jgi:CheY-like chemotaxis protein
MLRNTPVLVAEDDPNDAFLLERAFESVGIKHPLVLARDGQEAINYLSGDREQCPRPCLLLADLKMPRADGFVLLKWLQGQDQFKGLPAVVLSSSSAESDMTHARELGAREYLVKPCDFYGLVEVVRTLQACWLEAHCPGASWASEPAHHAY